MSEEITFFAKTRFRNHNQVFGIKTDDRRRHMYIIGKSGMGKTTLLEQMVTQDIANGHGVAYIDPHGDTAEKMLTMIPPERVKDVIYFNPADQDFPIAFNVLEQVDPQYRHLVASGIVGVFKKLWADSWGPRLEYILRNAVLALLETPNTTLLGVMKILVDKKYQKRIVANITDPVVRSFWVDEFPKWNDRVLQEVIAPIQNKVGQFLTSALIRNIVGQPENAFSIRDVMDGQKILIMNLSKGRIGEDNSALLGAMMITKIQMAAMSRVDLPEHERKDFYLYVDEFQNFATESFANILSEARKYRLSITLAHQYIAQIQEEVRDAVFGNVGTMVTFRVGAADAEFMEKEFEPIFMMNDIINLPKYHIYLKLMIDGVAADAFSATTLPPVEGGTTHNQQDAVIAHTRTTYATPREEVERRIAHWSGLTATQATVASPQPQSQHQEQLQVPQAAENVKQSTAQEQVEHVAQEHAAQSDADVASQQRSDDAPAEDVESAPTAPTQGGAVARESDQQDAKPVFAAKCDACAIDIQLPFQPDGKRPVFCRDCLAVHRSAMMKAQAQSPQQVKNAAQRNRTRTTKKRVAPVVQKVERTVVTPQDRPMSLAQMTHIAPKKFTRSFAKPHHQNVQKMLNNVRASMVGDDVSASPKKGSDVVDAPGAKE